MKKLLLTVLFSTALTSGAYAETKGVEPEEAVVTPYGDYCSCSNYGICKKELNHKQAVKAIMSYFKKKNLFVRNISAERRFVKADIYRGEKLVDRVIFDRKTGRLRSIY